MTEQTYALNAPCELVIDLTATAEETASLTFYKIPRLAMDQVGDVCIDWGDGVYPRFTRGAQGASRGRNAHSHSYDIRIFTATRSGASNLCHRLAATDFDGRSNGQKREITSHQTAFAAH